MINNSMVNAHSAANSGKANQYFNNKLSFETDCSDVYTDIKNGQPPFVLVDVRSPAAYQQSHAITAINIPVVDITLDVLAQYDKGTLFVVYCWGPGCNGATKAAIKLSKLGFSVKEMIGGIHYWEDLERYPVNRIG